MSQCYKGKSIDLKIPYEKIMDWYKFVKAKIQDE